MESTSIRQVTKDDLEGIMNLAVQLNPTKPYETLLQRQQQMFDLPGYMAFGVFEGKKLIALTSGWTTVRWYCGKQLELDNVIVDQSIQSKGLGKKLMTYVESWALEHGYDTVELNTYVQNDRSHKFYFNQGFKIIGFHFQKELRE